MIKKVAVFLAGTQANMMNIDSQNPYGMRTLIDLH